jgi:phage N-6-adenine-methyltransferase
MSERWRTPPEIFDPLMTEFRFDLDAAADFDLSVCANSLQDALSAYSWPGQRIWLNPPYGLKLEPFVRRAHAEWKRRGKVIVALIPFRCRAAWWHECVIGQAEEVRCVRKRPHFLRPDGSRPKFTGSCDSCVVLWRDPVRFTRMISL